MKNERDRDNQRMFEDTRRAIEDIKKNKKAKNIDTDLKGVDIVGEYQKVVNGESTLTKRLRDAVVEKYHSIQE